MAATLHRMLEEYISWRRGSQGLADDATDAVIDAHEDMRLSLLRSLEAPTITDITASRNLAANRATASIWASATHPAEVAQLSYAFRQGSTTNIYGQGELYGSGRSRKFTLHAVANPENQTTQDWSVFVRARG